MKRLLPLCVVLGCTDPVVERAPLTLPVTPESATPPTAPTAPPTDPRPPTEQPRAPQSAPADHAHTRLFADLQRKLRTQNPYAVLRRVPIHRITPPVLGPADAAGARRQTGPDARLDPAAWLQRLNRWEHDGFVIERTDWRPRAFAPGPPARSQIAATVHIRKEDWRAVLRGTVHVRWRKAAPREVWFEAVELTPIPAGEP